MFSITAKYNQANIMLPEHQLEQETRKQIYSFLNHPAFGNSYIAIMPDCHAGAGAVIGLTMRMNDYVIPNVVGVDIGCGVLSVCLGDINIDFVKLDQFIRSYIPSGFNVNEDAKQVTKGLDQFISTIMEISLKIGSDAVRHKCSLGSLGGGNHFIEIGIDQQENKWLTIHSGSRKFGLDVAVYHQKKAKQLMKKMFVGDAYKDLEFLPTDQGGQEYLVDMGVAQKFAEYNRKIMAQKICDYLMGQANAEYVEIRLNQNEQRVIESVHNFVDFRDKIIRKGAIRAYEEEKLIIPFNMEDGLIIGRGKSNSKWNYSAPHGAGRVLSRKKAKELLNLQKAKESMQEKGIFTTSLSKDTLDECKPAYKDKELILEMIKETVEVEHFVKPLYNFKAG